MHRHLRRLLGLGTLLTLAAAAPATASAATPTHAFRVDLTVNTTTDWDSYGENQVCSDRRFKLTGSGAQATTMRAKNLLVTLRGKTFAFPGTKGAQVMPSLGRKTFIPLKGRVGRRAAYEMSYEGPGDTCLPGRAVGDTPSVRTCGLKQVRGGLYTLVPFRGAVTPMALTLLDDPFDGECPAESMAATMLLPTERITHGAGALAKLRDPRVRKVSVEGRAESVTHDPFGFGEIGSREGEQRNEAHWYMTFRRVG